MRRSARPQAAVDADPLRESPHAALIAVQLREGNESEALALARVGLLVIRAWVEEGSERPLRVEVRLTAGSGRGVRARADVQRAKSGGAAGAGVA